MPKTFPLELSFGGSFSDSTAMVAQGPPPGISLPTLCLEELQVGRVSLDGGIGQGGFNCLARCDLLSRHKRRFRLNLDVEAIQEWVYAKRYFED